jgi:predicted MFS family arabinose efflux permease
MSISSVNPRRIAVAAGCGALAIGLPYGAAAYASPALALMALCVCGLGFAGYRRTRNNRLSPGIE